MVQYLPEVQRLRPFNGGLLQPQPARWARQRFETYFIFVNLSPQATIPQSSRHERQIGRDFLLYLFADFRRLNLSSAMSDSEPKGYVTLSKDLDAATDSQFLIILLFPFYSL